MLQNNKSILKYDSLKAINFDKLSILKLYPFITFDIQINLTDFIKEYIYLV